ncbi:MAG: radical SAM protein [Candidatus Woesearchaeota archaeon]
MKICLINQRITYGSDRTSGNLIFLNGIMDVDAALTAAGYDVKIADLEHDRNAGLDYASGCTVACLTSVLQSYDFFKDALPQLKRDGKTVIVGGQLMSSYGLSDRNLLMRAFPEIDFGVVGEAELTAPALLGFLQGRNDMPGGVIFRDGTRLRTSGQANIIQKLDSLPESDYSRWPDFSAAVKGNTANFRQTARGCYAHCSFCYKMSEGLRSFSEQRIMREFENISTLGARQLHFSDNTFTYDYERTARILEKMPDYIRRFTMMTRADKMNPALARDLKNAGCSAVKFGVESLDHEILRRTGKGITPEQVRHAVECSKDAGLDVLAFMIIGLPGECRKSLERTVRSIKEMRLKCQPRLLIPLPGTWIYDEAVRLEKIDEMDMLRQFSNPEYYSDTKDGNWVPVNMSDGLTDQELIDARDEIKELRMEFER